MNQRIFQILIVAVFFLLFAGFIRYIVAQKKQANVAPEIQVLSVPTEENMEPTIIDQENTVVVDIDKQTYAIGEKIEVKIKNSSDSTIWLKTACGMPVVLLKKRGDVWEPNGAYPTKLCAATPPTVEPGQTASYVLDLENMYAHTFFSIEPGTYKLEVEHTSVDEKLWPVANFSFLKAESEEFTLYR